MSRHFLLSLLFVCSLALADQAIRPTLSSGIEAVGTDERQAVELAMKEYAEALRVGTPETVVAHYTIDGQLLLPGLAPLRGREAIRAFLAPLVASTEVESVEVNTEVVETHGNTADQWGTYRQVAGERGKAKQTFQGRYAALWYLEKDGRWRLFRLMMQPV